MAELLCAGCKRPLGFGREVHVPRLAKLPAYALLGDDPLVTVVFEEDVYHKECWDRWLALQWHVDAEFRDG